MNYPALKRRGFTASDDKKLPWLPVEVFPVEVDSTWSTEGDCNDCQAEIKFYFDADGKQALEFLRYSK